MKERKLKILFIPSWYPSSRHPVAGVFIKEHAKAVSLYNDVVVIYNEGYDKDIKGLCRIISDKEEEGIRTIRVKHKKFSFPKVTYFAYLCSFWYGFKVLMKEGWYPDIIHAHVYSAGVPAVILGKLYRIPVVITEHWSGYARKVLHGIEFYKMRFALNRANVILPVSDSLKKAIKSYGISGNFKIVPNTVDIGVFYPVDTLNEQKRILFVGLLTFLKGLPYLLQAIAKVKEKRDDFVLDIIGDGPERKKYEELTRSLGLSEIVHFHGFKSKSEVADFMRNSSFLVLPSLWENLPCVLIEAMASGLPIIASKIGGIPEIINNKIGVLVPPKDVDALANAIDWMLDHYKDYSKEEIVQYVKDKFSYKAVGKTIDKIYREIIRIG